MPFNYEKEMAAPVAAWLKAEGLLVKQEFKSPWGLCDLVGCELDPEKTAIRIRQRQWEPLGPAGRVYVHQQLPDAETARRGVTLEQLQGSLNYSQPEKLEADLERLVATGHAKKTDSGRFLKINGWAPLQKRLIAVELKLSRYSEAVAQAKANRNFARQSYVAMPLATAERAVKGKNRILLLDAGVGMIGVTDHDCVVLLQAPIEPACDVVFEMHAVEQFWRISGRGN